MLGDSGADAEGWGGSGGRDACPCLSFPTCKRGVTGAAARAMLLQPRSEEAPSAPSLGLPALCSLQTAAHRAGPAHVGQGWSKISGSRNFFIVFRSYPRNHHTPPPHLYPQRSSSSSISDNAFIRLHDAITTRSQKM